MELIKETVNINETVCRGTTQVMVEGDVIVPDTKPDILKLLQVDAVSRITDRELSEGGGRIRGRVDMAILYIPDNNAERIRGINTSIDFSQRIDNENISPEMMFLISSNVERVEFTALNSRKLKLKAIVEIKYEAANTKAVEIPSETEGDKDIEVKKETIKVQNTAELGIHEFNIKECIEVPSGQNSIGEILKNDIEISDTEYKTLNGKIVAKGVLCVCILYTDTDGTANFMEAELPFTEVFDAQGVGEDTVCEIDYSVIHAYCEPKEDSDGDMRLVELDIEAAAQIKACDSIELEMISDCFAPFKKTGQEISEVEIEETAAAPSLQNTIRETVEFSQGMPGVENVYNVITRPLVTKTQIEKNKLLCEGRIEAYILYLSDSSENPIYSMKKDIPFSYMMDVDTDADDNLTPRVRAEIKHTSYNLNAAGEVEIRSILSINANIMRKRKLSLIDSLVIEDRVTDEKNCIVIYFVQAGDELWDIAKNYCVPREEIMKFNDLSDDKLKVGQRLFIPAGK